MSGDPIKSDMEELKKQFQAIDTNGDGFIDLSELKSALDLCGFKVPGWQIRKMIEDSEVITKTGLLSFADFCKLCTNLKANEVGNSFKQLVSKKLNVETIGGMSDASSADTTHSVSLEEQIAFSDWINSSLKQDSDLKHVLPIDTEGKTLYDSVKDGIVLCKIINHSCPETIDERAINKKNLTLYAKLENSTLALVSSQAIGCNIINIDADDLVKGKQHLVLGLLWQIIRIGLFNQITLGHCPGLPTLLLSDEKIGELKKLSPESILLRWVNHHMEGAGIQRRCLNFQNDIADSEIYLHLIKQIAPKDKRVTLEALSEQNRLARAELMLKEADKLGCRSFVSPSDVVNGVYNLNLAFVANLFNKYNGLKKPDITITDNLEETREEKTYRNWMNSLGVTPYVNWIYSDLADGLVIFQLFDIIKPGIVVWSNVQTKFSRRRAFIEEVENCNYAVELGKQFGFSLVGISGQDLNYGIKTLMLALVWQLMRAYTLMILTRLANTGRPIGEAEIVTWVNRKLSSSNKGRALEGFQDPSISDARIVIDLVDSIKPGTIDYTLVKKGETDEEKLENAKYAISMARKTGAHIYALPEDITEVKPKMIMTVFACLMALDCTTAARPM